jgi:hypothetical protein
MEKWISKSLSLRKLFEIQMIYHVDIHVYIYLPSQIIDMYIYIYILYSLFFSSEQITVDFLFLLFSLIDMYLHKKRKMLRNLR